MRSRYSAYSLGKLDYIAATCAGPAAQSFNRAEAALSLGGTTWLGLTITGTSLGGEGDETGTVSFSFECQQKGQHIVESETSAFRKIDGRWMYYDRVDRGKTGGAIGRNDPCPCGSGKKYKKCHGA